MIKIFFEKNDKTVRYTFETIFSILSLPYNFLDKLPETTDTNNIYIYYGKNDHYKDFKSNSIIIHSADSEYINTHKVLLVTLNEEKLPVFYGKQHPKCGNPLVFYEDGASAVTEVTANSLKQIYLGFDLIKTIFFLISRWEEMNSEKKDNHERFLSEESILVKMNLHEIAVIDIYIKFFETIIINISNEKNVPLIKKSLWPNNKKFAVCLTHDVDRIKARSWYRVLFWSLHLIKYILKCHIKEAKIYFRKIKRILFMKADSYWNFEKWIELEKKYGVKSSFYFISRDKNQIWKKKDLRYTINNNSELIKMIRRLRNDGWDVGLHGDYDSYLNVGKMNKERRRIERIINDIVYGIRQHYLRFNVPTSWQIQEKTGLHYDTTLGWDDRLGFRCGLSYPFFPYDIINNEKRKILEIPLIIMDGIFIISDSQNKEQAESFFSEIIRFLNQAEKYGSLITLLWHQSVLDETDYPYLGQIYERILQYLQNKNVFVGSGKEIMEWWVQREGVKVIEEKAIDDQIIWKIRAGSDMDNLSFVITGSSNYKNGYILMNDDYIQINKTGVISIPKIKEGQEFKITLNK